jgi:hypothetical protein
MKLNEIHPYHDDPNMDTFNEWATPIIHELSDILGDWEQKNNTIRFELNNDEEVTFRFSYKPKTARSHHRKVGDFTVVNAHSIDMKVTFAPQQMNIAALHDDPEVQKKLMNKIKRPLSYFEQNPEQLDEIIQIMKHHGADACTATDLISVDMDNPVAAHAKLDEISKSTSGGQYGTDFSLDFLFLTEPLS